MERMPSEKLVVSLVSDSQEVNNLTVEEGQVVMIGRNRLTNIKDIKCPRKLFEIELRAEESSWFAYIKNMKNGETGLLQEGQEIKGPGFNYEVRMLKKPVDFVGTSSTSGKSNLSENSSASQPGKKAKLSYTSSSDDSSSSWDMIASGSILVYKFLGGGKPCPNLAGFDFDGTLVKVKGRAKFPKDGSDWLLFDKRLPELIRNFSESHRFVIFSNQLGVSVGHMQVDNVKQRAEEALKAIGVPCLAFFALKEDQYRKPSPGMYNLYQRLFNDNIPVELSTSFYVGDAAGRRTALNKDHSSADIEFAVNSKLPFLTPEEFLAGRKPRKVDATALIGMNSRK